MFLVYLDAIGITLFLSHYVEDLDRPLNCRYGTELHIRCLETLVGLHVVISA